MVANTGEQIMTLGKRIFMNGWQSIATALGSVASLIAPAIPAIITAFSFITIDLYYGYKVSSQCGHKKIESNKLWKTVNKYTEAAVIIASCLLLDKYIFMTYEDLYAVRIAAGAVCLAETFSLLEALRALHPNSYLSKILSKIVKSKAEKYLDVDMSDIIKEKVTNDTNNTKD